MEKGHPALGCLEPLEPLDPGGCRRWAHCGGPKPERLVSLRSIDDNRWSLQVPDLMGQMHVVEEVEEWMAFYQIYEGAAYMNNGRTYLVQSLDFENRVAVAKGPVQIDYYTSVRDMQQVETSAPLLAYPALPLKAPSGLHETSMVPAPQSSARVAATIQTKHVGQGLIAAPHYGPATVTKSFLGYTKFKRISGKWLDTIDLQMPQVMIKTYATWIPVPDDVVEQVKAQAKTWEPAFMPWQEHLRGGLHAASHALINVLPLFARTSANDALTICDYPAAQRYRPRYILIGDRCKGGNGLSLQAYRVFRQLILAAIDLVSNLSILCSCLDFCACTHRSLV